LSERIWKAAHFLPDMEKFAKTNKYSTKEKQEKKTDATINKKTASGELIAANLFGLDHTDKIEHNSFKVVEKKESSASKKSGGNYKKANTAKYGTNRWKMQQHNAKLKRIIDIKSAQGQNITEKEIQQLTQNTVWRPY